MITRPLLAFKVKNLNDIRFPCLATPKLDGIRCLKIDGKVVSRTYKPIGNIYIREKLTNFLPNGIDGEIMIPGATFSETSGSVRRGDGKPDFVYNAFDLVTLSLDESYSLRVKRMQEWDIQYNSGTVSFVKILVPIQLNSLDDLAKYEEKCLAEGHEGVILRRPDGPYKLGRSTLNEQILLAIKRFEDAEAEIIGFEEQMHNTNEKEEDEFGFSKRSSCKDGLVPAGTLGKLLVKDIESKVEFKIGTGFNDALRNEIWHNKESYLGKIAKYKYQLIGTKDKPRIPVFVGFRDKDDM